MVVYFAYHSIHFQWNHCDDGDLNVVHSKSVPLNFATTLNCERRRQTQNYRGPNNRDLVAETLHGGDCNTWQTLPTDRRLIQHWRRLVHHHHRCPETPLNIDCLGDVSPDNCTNPTVNYMRDFLNTLLDLNRTPFSLLFTLFSHCVCYGSYLFVTWILCENAKFLLPSHNSPHLSAHAPTSHYFERMLNEHCRRVWLVVAALPLSSLLFRVGCVVHVNVYIGT